MNSFSLPFLALPGVVLLISFLSYGPQILFLRIEPRPLSQGQSGSFNLLISCIWICYFRACFTDAGHVPSDWSPSEQGHCDRLNHHRERWCRKCARYKPPRAHHCKVCKRYIQAYNFVTAAHSDMQLIDAYPRWIIIALGRTADWLFFLHSSLLRSV